MTAAAARAAATVAVLLAGTAMVSAAEVARFKYSRPYYWNGCKAPCTTNKPGYKVPMPYPAKPDPKRAEFVICQPGYGYVPGLTGYTTPMCVPCESGFYSPGLRSKCLSCAGAQTSGPVSNAGFVTPQGASSASQCVCAAGFGGPSCTACAPGTFSPGGRLGPNQVAQPSCQVCPDGSQGSTKTGAMSRLECGGCNPGFGGLGCKPCPAGKYSTGGSYAACKSCGPNQSSRPQSPGPEYCTCAAGYGSDDGKSCAICPVGTYWPGAPRDALNVGDPLARASSATKATLSGCLPCSEESQGFLTLGQGSTSVDQCVCRAGYGSKLCTICPTGTWSAGGATAECTQCGGLGVTDGEGSTSANQCGCPPGSGGVDCQTCPANSYSTGGTQSSCQPCPVNTEAPAGSSSPNACVPKPGYGITTDGIVVACPANTWSTGGILQACEACPAGTVSPSASTNVKDCVCQPGFKPAASGCVQCREGEICPGGAAGGAVVVACPAGATSPPGSSSPADCVCKPGYGGDNCDLCPVGFFSPGNTKAGCQACGLGKTSPAGSISADACVCLAGRGGPNCDLCPAGTFSAGLTSQPCSACPAGSTTVDSGSVKASDCMCQPGFGGPFCTQCAAGELCPGGTRLAPVVCPANAFAPAGATTPQQCVCNAGYGRVSGSDACEACPVGTWSSGSTRNSCTPCGRTMTTATVAATSADACFCKPGFGGANCTQCPANAYSAGFSFADCEACPPNSKSAPGSTSSTACVCAAGFGGPACEACPAGTFSTGGSASAPNAPCARCGAAGSGFTTNPLSAATSDAACVCKAGFGGPICAACPANTFGAGGNTDACLACPAGTVSQPNSASTADCKKSVCPAGQELSTGADGTQVACVCKAGHGSGSATSPCSLCPAGTYAAGGSYDACKPCGFGLTGPEGAISKDQCVASKVKCPAGMAAGPGAVSAAECACLPGYGSNGSGACAICPAGTYSPGVTATDSCTPCGFGFTSPAGSSSAGACYAVANACPPGMWTQGRNASTTEECVCEPGHGAGLAGTGCHECPIGTYSEGTSREACYSCPFGTTSAAGSPSRDLCVFVTTACPVGMTAPLFAASAAECACMAGYGTVGGSKDSCQICPVGTFSSGGYLEACRPCGFGFTSPAGSMDASFCYATDQCPPGTRKPDNAASSADECICKPGMGGNALATLCTECPAGTYSANSGREACRMCPFGTFSAAGASSVDDCKPVAQECPTGMAAAPDAASAQECGCLAGYGIADPANPSAGCAVCPAGTYSAGGGREACFPCGFGLTSPVNSNDATDCYPIDLACPPGMEIPGGVAASTQAECACKPGYGAPAADGLAICALCPAGTFSAGGTREQCTPCPFGTTSAPGSTSAAQCIVSDVTCPAGQISDPNALECHCRAGFGAASGASCQICPVGTFGDGFGIQPCMPCGFGLTSPVGSASALDCYLVNQCPVGMWVDPDSASNPPSSATECTCKPGYGGNADASACYMCTFGTWNNGKNGREPCQSCGFGFTGPEGATDGAQCQRVSQECPNGQGPNGEPSDPTSAPTSPNTCACLPGFGSGGIDMACTLCPAGSYSRGGTWQPCQQCPAGTTSIAGAKDVADCLTDVNLCPAGMVVATGATTQASQCVCKSGTGAVYDGATVVGCVQCMPGTFSAGGSLDKCQSCPVGYSSSYGASSVTQCTQCPTGFFGTDGKCSACPIGTTTLPGYPAAFQADCNLCAPGFGVASGGCQLCAPGTYSAGGSTACQACPIGMVSEAGASLSSQCYCFTDGYGTVGNDTSACIACPRGSYSSQVRGRNTCVACPAGMTTLSTGKSSPAACVCDAGYGSWPNTTASCQPCIAPFYQGSWPFGGVPATTATEANPYPECVLCLGAKSATVPSGSAYEATGDVNMLCTADTTRPSAYCASISNCGFSLQTYTFNASGTIVLPEGVLSIELTAYGASGSAGRSIWTIGSTNQTTANSGGVGGKITASVTGDDATALSGQTLRAYVGRSGGKPGNSSLVYGGAGGGYSAVILGNADPANLLTARWLVSAAGGGGGGASTNLVTGTSGAGANCASNFITTTLATQASLAVAAVGGTSMDASSNGANGVGPAGQTGNGGSGSSNSGNSTLGAAGAGGGGGYGLGFGAGGSATNSNAMLIGMAGGAPGGGGGGGAGVGPLFNVPNIGLSPGGGGGAGFRGGAGGSNTDALPGRGGLAGGCQYDSVFPNTLLSTSDRADGEGYVVIKVTTNTPVYP